MRVRNGRYEIPVPLKTNVLKSMPNNYKDTLNRTESLRQKDKLKRMLVDTFCEISDCWYLPFFVTKQDKPRVVFDEAAKFQGSALNDAVLSAVNLLNNLVDVLTRFYVDQYACMADLSVSSKCLYLKIDETCFVWFGLETATLTVDIFNYFSSLGMFGE